MTPSFVGAALAIARKDLLIEFRTRTAFLASIVFAVLALAVFYFAWDTTRFPAASIAPGVIWVIFAFAGMLAVHRSFGVEQPERAIDALLLSPVPREAIFFGKALANIVFLVAIQAIVIPAAAIFYNLPFGRGLLLLYGVAFVATIGLVAVVTLFSAMAVNTRLAELLVPMLSLPFLMPLVIGAAQSTTRILDGRPLDEASAWLKLLVAFDIVFVAACTLIFPYTIEE